MASPPPPSPPVGEDNWLDFIDQQRRHATTLEQRIHIVELYRSAVSAEPASIRVWIAYCDYFWSLYVESMQRAGPVADWPPEEQAAAADIFSLDTALHLWSEGHESTKFRLSDSHELWNHWIALERELLDRTRTAEGVRRITHLYRNRLSIPHATWDDTSSAFSSFLSEYNPAAYEDTMRSVIEQSRAARLLYERRDAMEMALRVAIRSGDEQAHRVAMARYLDWEVAAVADEKHDKPTAVRVAIGLFSRALTGIFKTDDPTWVDLSVFVSQLRSQIGDGSVRNEELARVVPNSLDILQRAVQHCPWSGILWARYIICGEQAGLSFADMERIKHAATNSALDRDGMAAVVDMYAAWCGYLRRSAMDPNASDEAIDLADSGLVAALEAVQVWGERRFGSAFQGDPNYRLERIMINHLTEKHGAIDEAREHWEKLAKKDILAHDYSFWMSYYMWEMVVSHTTKGSGRSPTMASKDHSLRAPSPAACVLRSALHDPRLNWPEHIMEVYKKHCNDFESAEVFQNAIDDIHQLEKSIALQRKEAAALQTAAQTQAYAHAEAEASARPNAHLANTQLAAVEPAALIAEHGGMQSPSGAKRKWEGHQADTASAKRAKNNTTTEEVDDQLQKRQAALKRDRENTSVFVANLPIDVTITKIRQYFRDYGHVNNVQLEREKDNKSAVALVEFRSVEDVQSAIIRDGKYFGERTISVKAATGVTLYLTNFPPTADDAYIHDFFEQCGPIFSIRWPSLKYNTHRRFCYVSFRDRDSATKAIQLDGAMLEGRFKLSVKYSDPTAKKAREGAVEEGREVHVKYLGFDVDESAVEKLFEKYGQVERVRLLRNLAGRSRGSAFVVFRTKAEAEQAVAELDKTKFGSQILAVELSVSGNYKPSAREASAAAESVATTSDNVGEEPATNEGTKDETAPGKKSPQDRTFALLGLPDTVNIARVRALIEPYGHVVKLVLRADHGGAIVEFTDAMTAAKAQLALDGTQLDERHRLRTGKVAELFREKAEIRVDRVDKSIRRPVASLFQGAAKPTAAVTTAPTVTPLMLPRVKRPVLGGKGAKRGIVFSGGLPTGAKKNVELTIENGEKSTNHTPAKKSNAEFRALFLGSSGEKEKENKTQPGVDGAKDKTKGAEKSSDVGSKMEVDGEVNGH